MRKILFMLLGASLQGVLLAAVSGTATWTGAAGDGKWATKGNWTFTDTKGAALAASAVDMTSKAYDYDFSNLPDGAVVVNEIKLRGAGKITLPRTAGCTWTFQGTTASDFALRYEAATVDVPAGSTLDWQIYHPVSWASEYNLTLQGGGTFIWNSARFIPYLNAIVVKDSTFVYRNRGDGQQLNMVALVLDGDAAKVRAEQILRVGYLASTNATPGAQQVELVSSGNYLMLANGSVAPRSKVVDGYGVFNGCITGGPVLYVQDGVLQTLEGRQDYSGTIRMRNGHLVLGETAAFSTPLSYFHELGGYLRLESDQTFRAFRSEKASMNSAPNPPGREYAYIGGLDVATGKTATFAGAASGTLTETFYGRIDGEGSIVKDGGDYTLILKGASRYKGATRVKAGTLRLESAPQVTDADVDPSEVIRLTFDDPAALNRNSAANGPSFTIGSGVVQPVSCEGVVGRGVYLGADASSYGRFIASPSDAHADNLPGPSDDWTISLWMQPDPVLADPKRYYALFMHGDWTSSLVTTNQSLRWISFGSDTSVNYFYQRCIHQYGEEPTQKTNAPLYLIRFDQPATFELTNGWHHVAVTCKDMKRRAYLDGRLVAEDAEPLPEPMFIKNQVYVGNGFVGKMDEVVYAKRAWTEAEVQKAYARVRSTRGEARDPALDLPAPVAHWAFEDPADPWKDTSGNGYDLEPMGNVSKVVLQENRPGAHGRYALVLNDGKSAGNNNSSVSYGALKLKGAFPAKIPTGRSSFTVSIRYQVPYATGYTPFYWGGATAETNNYFRVKCGSQPHTPRADFWNISRHPSAYHNATCAATLPMGAHVSEATWQHLVFVYDANEHYVYCYVDGVLDKKNWVGLTSDGKTSYPDILGEALYVGYCPDGTYQYIGGAYDDIRVYDRVLTPEQVILLTRSLEMGEVGPTLPIGTDVTIDAAGTLQANGAGHVFGKLEGAGRLDVLSGARVSVTNATTFVGCLEGWGAIRATEGGELTLSGDLSAFSGDFEAAGGSVSLQGTPSSGSRACVLTNGRFPGTISCPALLADGLTLTTDPAGANLPAVQTTGCVAIPASGTLAFATPPSRTAVYTLAKGASLDLPETFDGWTTNLPDNGKYKVRFEVRENGTAFVAKVSLGGMLVIFR